VAEELQGIKFELCYIRQLMEKALDREPASGLAGAVVDQAASGTMTQPPSLVHVPGPDDNPGALFLSAHGVAALLGVSVRSVWRMTREASFPRPIRRGRMVRWEKEAKVKWARRHEGRDG
jgi:predicted DNA-binding transcriptional regulator AlpA